MTEEKDVKHEEEKVEEADAVQGSREPVEDGDAGTVEEVSEPDAAAEEQPRETGDEKSKAAIDTEPEEPADDEDEAGANDGEEAAPSDEEAGPSDEPAAEGGDGEGSADEAITPKMERKLRRSRQAKPALQQRSFSEQAAERAERRAKKARLRGRSRQRFKEKRRKSGDDKQRAQPVVEVVTRPAAHKQRQGVVVSNKADKTITVQIETRLPHPVYKKIVRRTNRLYVHDERNEAKEGDTVRVVECRPLSRSKRWRLVEIVERAR